MPAVLGLDIGGANLKAAHSDGGAWTLPFALWKQPEKLGAILRDLIADAPPYDGIAVTMTGELCDCFASKSEGVCTILDAVATVADHRPIHVWTVNGFTDMGTARAKPLAAASANWLALAAFVCRYVQGNGVLIDIGSTTTDIIPLASGRPTPKGLTDTERLCHRELVYTGVRRTPLCAVLGDGVAAELFATTLDVYLLLGNIGEDAEDHNTADGKPATKAAARGRLARMLCADADALGDREIKKLAERALLRQVQQLTAALEGVVAALPGGAADTIIISGEGEFLARLLLRERKSFRGQVVSLADKLGPALSRAACAYAVADLVSSGRSP
jgi:(4-(4-[2-(gamma-L-glutamylamino)ethyl]phenoxymethyl)furan-2-yl)methanamine synthase